MRKEDIKQVLTSIGTSTFRDSGDSVMVSCPLSKWEHESGGDRRPSMGIKIDQGMSVVHCFTCSFRGGLVSLVRRYASHAVPEGLIDAEEVNRIIDFIFVAEDEEVIIVPELVEMPVAPPRMLSSLGTWHSYFEDRGITKESFDLWKLGFHEEDDRVLFPVFDLTGNDPVGIVGRAIGDDDVKYRNYPAKFKKSWFVYGLNLKPKEAHSLIVVEGAIDAIKVNQQLTDSSYWCVSVLGSEPSKTQMDLLVDHADEVICILDNDASGKKGEIGLIKGIGTRTILTVVDYPEGINDPDEADSLVLDMIDNRYPAVERSLKSMLRGIG